jgi:glyoxylase-like metal-dependent hydrolase (beta-lactamase superfamily II)
MAFSQEDELAKVQLKVTTVAPGLSMLRAVNGVVAGNVAVSVGKEALQGNDSVRTRLSAPQAAERAKKTSAPPDGDAGLPIVTFSEDVTLHLNGDTVHVLRVPPAHTDGDALVHFKKANAIHTGDLFLSVGYPYVDLGSGGRFEGFIDAADRIVALSDEKTRIIPGHGTLVGKAEVKAWRDILATVRARVGKLNRRRQDA